MAKAEHDEGGEAPPPPPQVIEARGQAVVLDRDVARLFGVTTRALNQTVKRNAARFGADFAFRLTAEEWTDLRSQFVISSEAETAEPGWGGARYLPNAFTEHGVVMAATLLNSPRAATASRFIVKSFVQARQNLVAKRKGQNLPATIDPKATVPLAAELRSGLMGKVNDALGHVLDALIDPKRNSTVRDEAREIAAEGLKSLKDYLRRSGIQNEKTLAEVRKLMAEAESLEVETDGKRTANEMKQLALLAKKLRLVLEAQHYLETGNVESLLAVLRDFDKG